MYAAPEPGDEAREGSEGTRSRAREAEHTTHRDERVHKQVPGDQPEQWKREHVHPLRGTDIVRGDAEGECGEEQHPADPRSPRNGPYGAADGAVTLAEALDGELGTAGNETLRFHAGADHLGRGATGPCGVGVVPRGLRRSTGFERADEDHIAGVGFVHAVGLKVGIPVAMGYAGASVLRREGTKAGGGVTK